MIQPLNELDDSIRCKHIGIIHLQRLKTKSDHGVLIDLDWTVRQSWHQINQPFTTWKKISGLKAFRNQYLLNPIFAQSNFCAVLSFSHFNQILVSSICLFLKVLTFFCEAHWIILRMKMGNIQSQDALTRLYRDYREVIRHSLGNWTFFHATSGLFYKLMTFSWQVSCIINIIEICVSYNFELKANHFALIVWESGVQSSLETF